MSYANSRIPDSAQDDVHEKLGALVRKHRDAPFRKPFADYNRHAFDLALAGWDGCAPLILDAGCGVGHGTIALARAHPRSWVIGVDQSESRLNRRKPYPDALLPRNMVFVRADLVDFWRLLDAAGVRLAHPVFPFVPRLGGVLECRTNWRVYIAEFASALQCLTGRPVAWECFEAAAPLTPFERKYRDSGQTLYRLQIDLGAAA